MGEVVKIAAFKSPEGHRPKRKREPFMLVPTRILEPLAKLEASVNAFANDTSNTGCGINWDAYYRVIAI